MRRAHPIALIALLLLSCAAQARPSRHGGSGQPGEFDYYALSLTWAPNFCASHSDPNECAPGKQAGFLVHGLWPQYQKGYPQSCSTQKLTPALQAKYGPVYASPGLITHEWSKHGTCSGLQPAEYFDLTAKLKQQIVIPNAYQRPAAPVRVSHADFAQAFKGANPGLADNSVLPFCTGGGRFLQETHICYDKAGKSQSCSPAEIKTSGKSCGQASFLLQSVK